MPSALTVRISQFIFNAYVLLHLNPPFAHAEVRIVGGNTVTNRSQFAFQASITYKGQHICAGTVVDSNSILTAAHCSFYETGASLRTTDLNVLVGHLKQNGAAYKYNVFKITSHPNYNPSTLQNDICIMEITRGFQPWNDLVHPIPLSKSLPPLRTECIISGWGKSHENSTTGMNALQFAYVEILNCNVGMHYAAIRYGMLCAGSANGDADSCNGDSGGPLVCYGQLVGIVSWGIGCGRRGLTGVYTDVSKYLDWIELTESAAVEMSSLSLGCVCLMTLTISWIK